MSIPPMGKLKGRASSSGEMQMALDGGQQPKLPTVIRGQTFYLTEHQARVINFILDMPVLNEMSEEERKICLEIETKKRDSIFRRKKPPDDLEPATLPRPGPPRRGSGDGAAEMKKMRKKRLLLSQTKKITSNND